MTDAATKTIAESRNELLAELAADNAGQVVFIRNDVFAKIKSYIARVADSEEIDLVEMDDHGQRIMKGKQYVFRGPVSKLLESLRLVHPPGVTARWTRTGGWE